MKTEPMFRVDITVKDTGMHITFKEIRLNELKYFYLRLGGIILRAGKVLPILILKSDTYRKNVLSSFNEYIEDQFRTKGGGKWLEWSDNYRHWTGRRRRTSKVTLPNKMLDRSGTMKRSLLSGRIITDDLATGFFSIRWVRNNMLPPYFYVHQGLKRPSDFVFSFNRPWVLGPQYFYWDAMGKFVWTSFTKSHLIDIPIRKMVEEDELMRMTFSGFRRMMRTPFVRRSLADELYNAITAGGYYKQ